MGRHCLRSAWLVFLVASAACAPARSGFYTVASTSRTAGDLGNRYVLVVKDATATVSKPVVVFPLGVPYDYDAMQQLLDQHNGDVLTNVRVTSRSSIVIVLLPVGSSQITVTADVWRIATAADVEAGAAMPLNELARAGSVWPGHEPESAAAAREVLR